MANQQDAILQVLLEYHTLAAQVDRTARLQEDRSQRMAELARLARTNQPEAQRQMRALNAAPTVWDFGAAVTKLRTLHGKSGKLLSPRLIRKT